MLPLPEELSGTAKHEVGRKTDVVNTQILAGDGMFLSNVKDCQQPPSSFLYRLGSLACKLDVKQVKGS